MKALKWQLMQNSFITLAENFNKWRPYLELLWWAQGGGAEISLGAAPPFETAPDETENETEAKIYETEAERRGHRIWFWG